MAGTESDLGFMQGPRDRMGDGLSAERTPRAVRVVTNVRATSGKRLALGFIQVSIDVGILARYRETTPDRCKPTAGPRLGERLDLKAFLVVAKDSVIPAVATGSWPYSSSATPVNL